MPPEFTSLHIYINMSNHNTIDRHDEILYPKSQHMRHYPTSRKVAGSIPDEVITFFN
jgi:hypothetical protein